MIGRRPPPLRDPAAALAAPGGHERAIAAHFGGRVRFAGPGPVLPVPLVLVGFTNRSGSTLLAHYLRQTGAFGGCGEFLNHPAVTAATPAAASFPDHVAALAAQACPGGEQLCLKASWDQIAMLARWNVLAMFPAVRVIHIRREDMLAQAVSRLIAEQTGLWTSRHRPQADAPPPDPRFDPGMLGEFLDSQVQGDGMIDLLAQALDLPLIHVTHEQILRRPGLHLQRLAAFCGVGLGDWQPRDPPLERQAGARNAAFAAAYRSRLRKALGLD